MRTPEPKDSQSIAPARALAPAQGTAPTPDVQLARLQGMVAALQDEVDALKEELAAVKSNNALALGPFVQVDPKPAVGVAGPHIIFSGVNLHLVSGSGRTDDGGNPRGLGNFIIGYNEDPALGHSGSLDPGERGGSHNVVIGDHHRFTRAAYGGLVAGENNTLCNSAASVSGGQSNAASGFQASVSGGQRNTASGDQASVNGGRRTRPAAAMPRSAAA